MTLSTAYINLAGLELIGAYDGKDYYIVIPVLEKALGWQENTARKKLVSKSLEAFAGKALTVGKKKASHGGFYSVLKSTELSLVLMWEALNGNGLAQALLVATNTEAIERRIDKAIGVVKTEDDYEANTREFFRKLSKTIFHPKYTSWLQNPQYQVNYGAEVNRMKTALRLPLTPVEHYTREELMQWSVGLSQYDILRAEGYSHARALTQVGLRVASSES